MISLNIASHKPREKHLQALLPHIEKQRTHPDVVNIYLNGYTKCPKWIPERYNVVCGDDLGASAKFYFADKQKTGVYMTLDDDLIPDTGYVGYLADMAMRYPDCLVGLHGTEYNRHPVQSYFIDEKRKVYYCYFGKGNNSFVDMLGTGALGFRVGLGLDISAFPVKNMTDPHLCKWAKENGVPMLCLQRTSGFVSEVGEAQDVAIWKGVAKDDRKQTAIINSIKMFKRLQGTAYPVEQLNDGSLEWQHMKRIANSIPKHWKLIELGSGSSSEYWRKCGINFESWEHHPEWANKTGAKHYPIIDGWYNTDRTFDCDVLLVDGPIGSTGYRYNLPIERITDRVKVIFVDDCHRDKDMELALNIATKTGRTLILHKGVQKILAEIR